MSLFGRQGALIAALLAVTAMLGPAAGSDAQTPPKKSAAPAPEQPKPPPTVDAFGLKLAKITPELRKQFSLPGQAEGGRRRRGGAKHSLRGARPARR